MKDDTTIAISYAITGNALIDYYLLLHHRIHRLSASVATATLFCPRDEDSATFRVNQHYQLRIHTTY